MWSCNASDPCSNRAYYPELLRYLHQPTSVTKTNDIKKPTHLICHVCGDSAPRHIHYGGIACFSCRAFFRRSVPKAHGYKCVAGDAKCTMSLSTRKTCQFCRYQKCLKAGMKESWVLSEEQKKFRLERKKNKAINIKLDDIECKPLVPDSNVGLSSRIGIWLISEEETRRAIPMTMELMDEVLSLIIGIKKGPLSQKRIVELFQIVYLRVARFAGSIKEFNQLCDDDKRAILVKNLDILSNIRFSVCLLPDATGDLDRQLRSAGDRRFCVARLAKLVPYDDEQKIRLNNLKAINMDQVFVEPWSRGKEHENFLQEVMTKLARFIQGDTKLAVLYQMVSLFANFDTKLRDRQRVEAVYEDMSVMMMQYLTQVRGEEQARVAFAGLLNVLPDLRRLTDILISHNQFCCRV